MKIILISRVASLGKIGDIVNVRDGYGKNFLIPQKKAIFYSVANYKIFEQNKSQFEADNNQNIALAEKSQQDLFSKEIAIIENASDDGRLYGSVSTADIAEKINAILGAKSVSRSDIMLKKPIKNIGVYDVDIDLYSGIFANVKVVIARSESEISGLIEEFNQSKIEVKQDIPQDISVADTPLEEVASE
jgi:large subunit ribosomal protein L9